MNEFVLYSRSYCHLCDDLHQALLNAFGARYPFTVEVIDVDADEALVALYDELVPVLMGRKDGELMQLCHYFLDEERIRAFLAGQQAG